MKTSRMEFLVLKFNSQQSQLEADQKELDDRKQRLQEAMQEEFGICNGEVLSALKLVNTIVKVMQIK